MHQSANQVGRTVTDINMTGNKTKIKKVFVIITVTVLTAIILYAMWYSGCFLPRWITWEQKMLHDQIGQYEITLENKKTNITYKGIGIWDTPSGVKVQDIVLLDIDSDNEEELILLCWKKGRYGKHKPFWVEKDEQNWSQHIFVYEFQEDSVKPKWMSSYIGLDVVKISVDDALSKKPLLLTNLDGETSYWMWDSWGFTKWAQEFN